MEDYMAGCQCEVLGFRIADDESMEIREAEQPQRYSLGDPAEILKDKAPCSAIADSCKNLRQFILLRRAQHVRNFVAKLVYKCYEFRIEWRARKVRKW